MLQEPRKKRNQNGGDTRVPGIAPAKRRKIIMHKSRWEKIQWKKITSAWEKKKKENWRNINKAKKRPGVTWTRLRGLKFLQIEEFKAKKKNFKNYKGKLEFLDGLIGEVRLWRKKGKRKKQIFEGKKIQRNNCKKKKEKKQEKRRIKKKWR